MPKLLIANRAEIAVRVGRAASALGWSTVAVYSPEDAASLHVAHADESAALEGRGAAAYLDIEQLVRVALDTGCDFVHPGYGFLSENAAFARACAAAGLGFVGPSPDLLDLFGDKVAARAAATAAGVAVLAGSNGPVDLAGARAFLAEHGPTMLKAAAGGGGRGIRVVRDPAELDDAFARCQGEARAAFGSDAVYVERYVPRARHIEVQVVGDAAGHVVQLGERDCSVQRRHQKIVEIAPAPGLAAGVRRQLHEAALALARSTGYTSLGTVEFLVDAERAGRDPDGADGGAGVWFIEANARLQVEHTITEEVTGVDLVETQLRLTAGETLADLGLGEGAPAPRGHAIQLRVNTETMAADGATLPAGGTLATFDLPSGPGLRVDTHGYRGYTTSAAFDSLLAKVIVHRGTGSFADTAAKAARALEECRIGGVDTNVDFLHAIVTSPDFASGALSTRFVEDHLDALLAASDRQARYVAAGAGPAGGAAGAAAARAGASIDRNDPLAVLAYGKTDDAGDRAATGAADGTPTGSVALAAPIQGTIVSLAVDAGDTVRPGQVVLVMESMKMEHEIRAEVGGTVVGVGVAAGDTLFAGTALLFVEPGEVGDAADDGGVEVDLDAIRADLAEIHHRHAIVLDDARPDAVARRRRTGQRTARENVDDLVDGGTWVEYGPMVVAAQKRRRTMDELLEKSPADGMVTGVGSVNGELFDDPDNRCAVMAYDYTVFAGTQGIKNHQKTDRLLEVAEAGRMPLVLFAEGGGGRPGDTDGGDQGTWTFYDFARLSGLVPMVGITSGRCYAGNASLLGCCDVIIATANSNIGMGGPAMIEGGGLGIFRPEEIGPMEVQTRSGVVDIAVADEAEAVQVAKRYLSYFQGRVKDWEAPDQRLMRQIVPENRLRVYEVRQVIETIADTGSVLELRRDFGVGVVTAFIRIEGRPIGVVANNPKHLGGAIDSEASDKGARFMQLCDAFDIPVLFLVDTPGIMVGPEVEKTALVRHSSRMFLVGANLSVPCYAIILRKAYGLGCIAVSGGSFRAPLFTVAWPTGEFGGMGLEGAVKLGFRDVLASIQDPAERLAAYEKMVASAYQKGKALRYATGFAIDDTIDPADSRYWLSNLMASIRPAPRPEGKKRPFIDAW
ncbi:MAG: biotin/lipoyl-binding protein [Acidimicrobiia bacterium]|nr:biotin/lipoyl-binding protein [Acidimicrobiia bacterium]